MKLTATDILRLLKKRYGKDHFFTSEIQCGQRRQRFDAIAIAASWSKPAVHGFEVKVSRRDFLGDDKWTGYLDYCKQFWFVTAPGVVEKSEIPEQAGWFETSKNGAVLYLRKKAPAREIEDGKISDLFRQVIHRDFYGRDKRNATREEKLEAWQQWLDERKQGKEIGWKISYEVARSINETNRENELMLKRCEQLSLIDSELKRRGFNIHGTSTGGKDAEYATRIVNAAFPETSGALPKELEAVVRHLERTEKEAEKLARILRNAASGLPEYVETKEDAA